MSKAKSLLKQVREGLSELQSMSKALPKSDQEELSSIMTSFGKFEKGLDDVPVEKETKVKGTIPMDAKEDSMRI